MKLRRQIRGRGEINGSKEKFHLKMNLANSQKPRWQKAAKQAEQDLLSWTVLILDRAAVTALETSAKYARTRPACARPGYTACETVRCGGATNPGLSLGPCPAVDHHSAKTTSTTARRVRRCRVRDQAAATSGGISQGVSQRTPAR